MCFSILSYTLYKIDLFINFVNQSIEMLKNFILIGIRSFNNPYLLFFFSFYICYIVYFSLTLNYGCDELTTYFSFIETSILRAIGTYPEPNNHVFFSLLNHIISPLSSLLTKPLELRILPIIISALTWIVTYLFVNKYYGKIALPITMIFMLAFINIQYSFSARGYGLLNFFFILCFYAATNITNRESKKDWIIFIISGILGAYTIPSFLYPFLTCNIYIFLFKPKKIFTLVKSNLIVGIGVFILYSPILFIEGFESLSSNTYVKPQSRLEVIEHLPNYLFKLPSYLFGLKSIIFFCLLVIGFTYSFFTKQWRIIKMYILFIFMLPCILILHSVLPFERIFVYYTFIFVFLILIPFSSLINNYNNIHYALLIMTFALSIISFTMFPKTYNSTYSLIGYHNQKITDKLLQDNTSFCLEYSDFRIFTLADYLKFESETKKFESVIIDIIIEGDTTVLKYKDISKYNYYIRSITDTTKRISKDDYLEYLDIPNLNLIIYKKRSGL